MAALVVRDARVRRHFKRVSFLSVGLEPDILSLQRSMYLHFSGKPMPLVAEPTIESNRAALRDLIESTNKSDKYLLVLDDIWSSEHEVALNCFQDNKTHAVLITTRTARLVPGALDINLSLLSREEGEALLAKMAGIEPTTKNKVTLQKIVELCGYLPLFLNLVSVMIRQIGEGGCWEEEILECLEKDRTALLADSSIANRIVESSLSRVCDENSQTLFLLLGALPEDRECPWRALEILWMTRMQYPREKKLGALERARLRASLYKLIDANLCLGGPAVGVKLHDIIRDHARTKWGEEKLKEFLADFVDRLIDSTPEGKDFSPTSPDSFHVFVTSSLSKIMGEALPKEITLQSRHLKWLSEGSAWLCFLSSFTVIAISRALGLKRVLLLAQKAKEAAEFLQSFLFFTAAFRLSKEALRSIDIEIGSEAANLYEKLPLEAQQRYRFTGLTLFALMTGGAADWEDGVAQRYQEKLCSLLEEEERRQRPSDPMLLASLGYFYVIKSVRPLGILGGEGNHLHKSSQVDGYRSLLMALDACHDAVTKSTDPLFSSALSFGTICITLFSLCSRSASRDELEGISMTALDGIRWLKSSMQSYDYVKVHNLVDSMPWIDLDFGLYPPATVNPVSVNICTCTILPRLPAATVLSHSAHKHSS